MALRDKLSKRVQPYLEPGEQVRHVWIGQTGPNPWWVLVSALIVLFVGKYYIFAVTDRGIWVFNSRKMKMEPNSKRPVALRLPRGTRFGPLSGLWDKTQVQGERVWIGKRFHKDVAAADRELEQLGAASGGQPLPPPRAGSMPPQS